MFCLKNKNFVFILLSTIMSGVGTGMTLIGIPWSLMQEYKSSSIIALLANLSFICTFFFLPYFSNIVDKKSRHKISLNLFLVGGLVQLIIWGYLVKYGTIIFVLFLSGVVSSLIRTCDQINRIALSQELFDKDDYSVLNRYLEVARQVITFLAGGGATIIFHHAGLPSIILCDAVTYCLGFLLIKSVVYPSNKQCNNVDIKSTYSSSANIFNDVLETFFYINKDKNVFLYLCITLIPYVIVVTQNVIYPAHFYKFINAGSEAFAFLAVPYGIGAIFAAWINIKSKKYIASSTLIRSCFILYIIFILLIIILPNLYVTFISLFVFAMAHAIIRIERTTYIMHKISEEQIGRVTGFFEILALLLNIMLAALVGYVADHFGVKFTWFIFAGAMLAALFNLSRINFAALQETINSD